MHIIFLFFHTLSPFGTPFHHLLEPVIPIHLLKLIFRKQTCNSYLLSHYFYSRVHVLISSNAILESLHICKIVTKICILYRQEKTCHTQQPIRCTIQEMLLLTSHASWRALRLRERNATVPSNVDDNHEPQSTGNLRLMLDHSTLKSVPQTQDNLLLWHFLLLYIWLVAVYDMPSLVFMHIISFTDSFGV